LSYIHNDQPRARPFRPAARRFFVCHCKYTHFISNKPHPAPLFFTTGPHEAFPTVHTLLETHLLKANVENCRRLYHLSFINYPLAQRHAFVKIFQKSLVPQRRLTANVEERFGSLRGEIWQISPRNLRSKTSRFKTH
jgi:hypothetical protein